MLAEMYLARCGSGFEAYMALQRALIERWVARGGTEQSWCERLAPIYRTRYSDLFSITSSGRSNHVLEVCRAVAG